MSTTINLNSISNWENQPCTKLQREYIENRRRELRMSMSDCLKLCNVWSDEPIGDIGQLTKYNASLVLDDLIRMCDVRRNEVKRERNEDVNP